MPETTFIFHQPGRELRPELTLGAPRMGTYVQEQVALGLTSKRYKPEVLARFTPPTETTQARFKDFVLLGHHGEQHPFDHASLAWAAFYADATQTHCRVIKS